MGKIIVTGAAGFIGARLVEALGRKSTSLVSVDHAEHFRSRGEHRDLEFGQIVDRKRLFDWLSETSETIDGVFHLGACTDTTELDVEFLKEVNLDYSKKIWRYCTDKQIPLVYASSAAIYGDGELGYQDEEGLFTDFRPLNPYGESKLKFDIWASDQSKKKQEPPAWSGFRFFNVYGFGERHKTKMSSVALQAFDQIQKSGGLKLFQSHKEGISDGHQKRDFIYVEDVVDVLQFAFEKPIERGVFNLGTGQARTFLDLGQACFKALDRTEKIEFIPTPEGLRERYQYFTEADMTKLRGEGYSKHFTALEDGVAKYMKKLQEVSA